MRKLILVFIGVALLAGLLAWAMMQNSGYLLIAFGEYSVEMSLWTALALLLLVYVVIRLIARLRRSVVSTGKGLISSDWFYRVRRDRTRTTRGFSHYLQGHWDQAQRNLLRGAKFSDAPALNYLGAAVAAHELGDKEKAGQYLLQAEAVEGASHPAAIVKARLYLLDKDYKSALLTLQQMQKNQAKDTSVLPLLVAARKGIADWDGLKNMLPELKRRKVFAQQQFQNLQRQVYLALLHGILDSQGEEANQLWKEIPGNLRRDSEIIAAYVKCLVSIRELEKGSYLAEKLLRKAIKQQWDDRLVSLYGDVVGEDPVKQLQTAEAWLLTHQDNACLLATLGKLSVQNEFWGKARDYFNQSLAIKPQADIHAQLGGLLAKLGKQEQSAECYRRGLMLVVEN